MRQNRFCDLLAYRRVIPRLCPEDPVDSGIDQFNEEYADAAEDGKVDRYLAGFDKEWVMEDVDCQQSGADKLQGGTSRVPVE